MLPAGRPRLLPRRQERQAADRVRAAHRPRRPPGRSPGLPRQHRRPRRIHCHRHGGAGQVRPGADGHGRRPGHDHLRPDRGPEPAGGRDRTAGRLRVDHRAARPRHQKAHGRRRPAPAQPLRPAEPGRNQPPRLPRGAANRLPQPGPGRRPRPHPQRTARRHRETARPHHRPGRRQEGWPAPARSASPSAR